jgi:23S rRNA maturation mini-RNase III
MCFLFNRRTKTHIYHAIVKSTVTYAAETWCLKAKTTAKLNSTEMDFWRRSVRISRKDKIRTNVIKEKMNVTRSLLEDVKTKQLQWYGQSKVWRRGDCQKGYWNGDRQGEGNEADPNLPGGGD